MLPSHALSAGRPARLGATRGFTTGCWDVDYTHNFVTTERRVRQLLDDGGFHVETTTRSIGAATGLARDGLAAGALLVNLPGVDAVSRYTHTEDLVFRIRKNLFETLAFVARKPASADDTSASPP